MEARYFRTPAELRRWLKAHHANGDELLVGFYKKAAKKKGVTYAEAVDEALCFGWIDGITRRIDEERYAIRFTPRRPGSNWSNVNVARVRKLIQESRMERPGLEAFERRDAKRTGVYSFERTRVAFDEDAEKTFRRRRAAWKFWEAQPPGYRRTATWWVMSAKREETRRRRLETLIGHSASGERLPQVLNPGPRR
ncbi:MAG: YdeI/OmpD-associated family protein [Actinomycetota bacterium]